MDRRNAIPKASPNPRRKLRFLLTATMFLLLAVYVFYAGLQSRNSRDVRLREAEAVTVIRSLGGEVEDQLVEEYLPLGRLIPSTGAAHYRFAIKLRNPEVGDDRLAFLDGFEADRVGSVDLLNCLAGDETLARAARFPGLTLLGLGQARNKTDASWPTGPTGLLTAKGFVHLANLPELTTVGLHGPDVTDAAVTHLKGARKLRVLILYGSRVTGAGLASIAPKPELSTLKLGGTRFGDDDLAALELFPAIETLDLRDTAVSDEGLSRLKALARLRRLSLSGCAVSHAAILELNGAMPGLAIEHTSHSTPPDASSR